MWRHVMCLIGMIMAWGLIQGVPAYAFNPDSDSALAACWKLDEGTGTVASDSSGNGLNGTVQGGALWVVGKIGGAIQCNGTNACVRAGHIPLNNQSFTVSLWVYPIQLNNQMTVFSQTQARATNTSIHFRLGGPGITYGPLNGLRMGFYSNDLDTPTGIIVNGEWYHLTCWYDVDSQIRRIYVNGEQIAEGTSTPYLGASGDTVLGSWDGTDEWFNGVIDDARVYTRPLTVNEIQDVMKGNTTPIASSPSPEGKATDVPRDAVLSWTAGPYAKTHDVYFGTVFDDVNNASLTSPKGVLVSQGQEATSYDPAGLLAFGQTYYWRVDEVNAPPTDSTRFKGETWSFTAEPFGYPVKPVKATASSFSNTLTQPGKTIDDSGMDALDQHSTSSGQMWLSKKNVTPIWIQYEFDSVYKLHQMWVWNQNQLSELDFGFGAMEVSIEVSTDGSTWTALANVPEFAQAPGDANYVHNTTVDFGGVPAKYVKLNILSSWGGLKQAGLSEVRFFYVPVKAYGPTPTSGTTGVALDAVLNWRPGREAVSHELYLGTDPNALSKVGNVNEHRYALGSLGLEYGKTYYWKVNEVNDAAATKSWDGTVWSFTTVEYAVVDDFESYDDLCNRIFWTWVDQYGYNVSAECTGAGAAGNGSGSTVGNAQAPYAERTIVNTGRQSLPMAFDNTKGPYYSETQREWTSPQVWTGGGANTLRVYLRGDPAAFVETSPGTILMNGIGTDIWDVSDQFRYVYKQLSGNGTIVARVDSLTRANEWSKAGVMIRETLDAGSAHACVAATPTLTPTTHGISYQRRLVTDGVSTNTDVNIVPATLPYWVKLTRSGNVFTAQRSLDGVTWVDIIPTTALTFTMANNVYIGLAVTSHDAALVSGAKFSNVSTTGGVSGSWQVAEIGVAQVGGNTPETFYVAVQDSAGKLKVVSHPDPAVIATGNWEEWNIPMSQFTSAGVNLNSVKKILIGVGDRISPKAGSAGKLYIDDIRLTRVSTP